MENYICPRCGCNVPGWQPVHLSCLLYRLRWFVISVIVIFIATSAYFVIPKLTRYIQSHPLEKQPTIVVVVGHLTETSQVNVSVTPGNSFPQKSNVPTFKETVVITNTPKPIKNTPTYTPIVNSPPNMIVIKGGTFNMGATEQEMNWHLSSCNRYASCSKVDYLDMMPQHNVQLDSFYIDIHEVTNEQYRLCAEAGICSPPSEIAIRKYLPSDYYSNTIYNSYPVVAITWHDADAYCTWNGNKRLLSEAEWEYAAKGNENRFFPWSQKPGGLTAGAVFNNKVPQANFCDKNCPMESWKDTNLDDHWEGPAPVMSFNPDPWGLYDMAGNVTEWVYDYYKENYYSESPLQNPIYKTYAAWRVTRGGGWNNGIYHLTSEYRIAHDPDNPKSYLGFRCGMDLENWKE